MTTIAWDGHTLAADKQGLDLSNAIALADRRVALCKQSPSCPSCGEQEQVQLVEWTAAPAEWRCRSCRYNWAFEP
jgi:transposase-like protein